MFRGREDAVNLLISCPISLNSFNDLTEAILPDSNQMSCANVDRNLAETLVGGGNVAPTRYGIRVDTRGDSTANFGKPGGFQSCAE